MCLTQAATVVELLPDRLVVDLDGRRAVVTNLLVPDARVGDHVMVGVGSALARLTRPQARRLRELHQSLNQDPSGVAAGSHPS
ncbi:MAG: HypC/HybG/HupF family hydrogenase formation chaperone [Chloroflexota bacterium]